MVFWFIAQSIVDSIVVLSCNCSTSPVNIVSVCAYLYWIRYASFVCGNNNKNKKSIQTAVSCIHRNTAHLWTESKSKYYHIWLAVRNQWKDARGIYRNRSETKDVDLYRSGNVPQPNCLHSCVSNGNKFLNWNRMTSIDSFKFTCSPRPHEMFSNSKLLIFVVIWATSQIGKTLIFFHFFFVRYSNKSI